MNLTRLITLWLLMAIVALSANGAVKANIASGLQNLRLEAHQEKRVAKPLMRQEKTECSTTDVLVIFIEEDKETGLLYAKARFYDPDTGKFLSEDAWEGDNMIAPSLHKYLYAYQNPTVWVDLTGNAPFLTDMINQLDAKADRYKEYALGERKDGRHRNATGASVISGANRAVGALVGVVNVAADLVIDADAITRELDGREITNESVVAESRANLKRVGKGITSAASTAANFHKREVRSRLGTPLVETSIGIANGDPEALNSLASGSTGSFLGLGATGRVIPNGKKGGGDTKLVSEDASDIAPEAGSDFLFRGTTEGFEGNPASVANKSTFTSTDPVVATIYAQSKKNMGRAQVEVALRSKLADVEELPASGYSLQKLEAEVELKIPASDFSQRATKKIPVDDTRATLKDMGVDIPRNIPEGRLSETLRDTPRLSDDQIKEFLQKHEIN